jgi:hypothetical protein
VGGEVPFSEQLTIYQVCNRLVAAERSNAGSEVREERFSESEPRVSQRVFRKQGFVERFSVSYGEFMYENKVVFVSIQEHESAILMDRSLG